MAAAAVRTAAVPFWRKVYTGRQAEHNLQMAVAASMFFTVFGIPFSWSCIRAYKLDGRDANHAVHVEELQHIKKEVDSMRAHADEVDNDIGRLCEIIDELADKRLCKPRTFVEGQGLANDCCQQHD